MRRAPDGRIRLSAGDLAGHLACRHLTTLDLGAARGELMPPQWQSPALAALRERGLAHERRYLEHLRSQGLEVVGGKEAQDVDEGSHRTRALMEAGAPVIVQATLADDRWFGRADVLRRVARPSVFGPWSYEVEDTKLARETRAGTILQLCLYSELLSGIQGMLPAEMHVVAPRRGWSPESFRVLDFLSYYRLVKRRVEAAVAEPSPGGAGSSTYPEPTAHCEICRWFPPCDRQRRADDHLGFVAGISNLQVAELRSCGVSTLGKLAEVPLPLPWRPQRGSVPGYESAREQARLQVASRARGGPMYELLPREPLRGLARLPAPSAGDIFLDLEGDPYAGEGGREYLVGWVVLDAGKPVYERRWALSAASEREAFEEVVDAIMERWAREPGLHVYHFAAYEPAALKRLMGRYGTREDEIDRMLRAGCFVDLHSIARQALRAGVESYSLKDLEALHGFRREQALDSVAALRRSVETALEQEVDADLTAEILASLEAYNRDDCRSALALRNWLETLREQLVAKGEEIPRPPVDGGEPAQQLSERLQGVRALRDELHRDLPVEPSSRSPEQQACWLAGHLLEWHRREEKATWWEYFWLRGLGDAELLEERKAISGLSFEECRGGTAKAPLDAYRFPAQEADVRKDNELHAGDMAIGKVADIDVTQGLLLIRKRQAAIGVHPRSVFAVDIVPAGPLEAALQVLARSIIDHGLNSDGEFRAARDLLLAQPPRLRAYPPGPLLRVGETAVDAALRLVSNLDGGVLPIQGPPGSGKTSTGARMICELVSRGKKVGATAVSHKVIAKLLDDTVKAADEEGLAVRCIRKTSDTATGQPGSADIEETKSNSRVPAALHSGEAQVAAGTVWLWARPEMRESVDVLFIDEAGQMSLANALAAALAARSLVLLGDRQQLDQPLRGTHPPGAELSALAHLLRDRQTMPPELGLFLPETWRLNPSLCEFTSEIFYDGLLRSRPGLERQRLNAPASMVGGSLWWVPISHSGNRNSSPEEADAVAAIIARLVRDGSWVDSKDSIAPLGLDDILVVAPYNAQVAALAQRLGPGARVGTVDKFQGQEAPVVIYSMATSSPEEAPHGMEFLYSLNRLNVATSRARCACVLVASPTLFEPDCHTPRQMHLANAFCRYLELALVLAL